eukprot:GHVT01012985.1.p1 GENE.GHVT01012985.1~~GHVT01012985.1.p1  ORF type:complete len:213 (-),score=20.78 GHVT01012985.1:1469-2107(-)
MQRLEGYREEREKSRAFRKEVECMRSKNKEINVERTRRRNDYRQQLICENLKNKRDKVELIQRERQLIWQQRREAVAEAQATRALVKDIIETMRLKPDFGANDVKAAVMTLADSHEFHALNIDPKFLSYLSDSIEAHLKNPEADGGNENNSLERSSRHSRSVPTLPPARQPMGLGALPPVRSPNDGIKRLAPYRSLANSRRHAKSTAGLPPR